MKGIFSKIRNAPLAATTGVMASFYAGQAAAQDSDLGSIADNINGMMDNFGSLALSAAFVAGVAFVGLGLARLKAAVDSQGQQVKYGEGVWRIALGSALVAVPAVITVMGNTMGVDNSDTINFTSGFE
ncbi:DUF6750 family protein [Salipiger mucosus]|uniref:Conjugative transfer protein TrbC n=1 Tax=Salipiger mucosus DSM 16094 TaxID=1123237 RepID=S9QR41_9RHOB|nr:DUF6750 family protein [Salipiger mucosus]EPX83881.1 hypothetical protein Salmuc_01656 [Salipiger mucosus DSM 16094]